MRSQHVAAIGCLEDAECSALGEQFSSEAAGEGLDLLQRVMEAKAGEVDRPSQSTQHKRVRPHVLYVLVDDLGFADVGFNNRGNPEVRTPFIDRMARHGVVLQRHYVANQCGPSRVAAQSGRLPVHGQMRNDADTKVTAGMSTKFTGIAEKLSEAGYKTHHVGKWDVGMATHNHMPRARGYSSSLGYFHKGNDQYTQECPTTHIGCCAPGLIDLWKEDPHKQGPARGLNGTDFQEFIFQRHMEDIIDSHDPKDPLFLFYAPHLAHCPLQVPDKYMRKFSWMTDDWDCSDKGYDQSNCRQRYRASVHLLDDILRKLVRKLEHKGMWDDLLIIFTSDNGGPMHLGASNYPLRGGKFTEFEGGYRGAAFVSGGFVPHSQRGKRVQGLSHIADWYTTLSHLGGVPFHDLRAEAAGAPQVDGLDLWPWLVGQVHESPRRELPMSTNTLLQGKWKYMRGTFKGAVWTGAKHPNASYTPDLFEFQSSPSLDCEEGCLYDVESDPGEHVNRAADNPTLTAFLHSRLHELKQSYWEDPHVHKEVCPSDTNGLECACWMAIHFHGGFYGPFAGQESAFIGLGKVKKAFRHELG